MTYCCSLESGPNIEYMWRVVETCRDGVEPIDFSGFLLFSLQCAFGVLWFVFDSELERRFGVEE